MAIDMWIFILAFCHFLFSTRLSLCESVFEEEPACLLLIYRHIFSVSYIYVDLDIMPALLMNGESYRIGLIAVAVILTKYGRNAYTNTDTYVLLDAIGQTKNVGVYRNIAIV